MTEFKYKSLLTKEFLINCMDKYKHPFGISKVLQIPNKTIIEYLDLFEIPRNKFFWKTFDEDFFSRDNEESFYVAGFTAADGSIGKDNALGFSLKADDVGQLELIKKLMKADNNIKTTHKSISYKGSFSPVDVSRVTFISKKMKSDLERFNIVSNKTLTYEMPEWLIKSNMVHHFLRGYSDGDFCWRVSAVEDGSNLNPMVILKTLGTYNFLNQFLNILCENNINVSKKKPTKRKDANVYYIDFGGNIICSKLCRFMYKDATIYMQRKYDIAIKAKDLAIHLNRDDMSFELLNGLYKELGTQKKVAEKLGYGIPRISQLFKKFGVSVLK